MKNSFKSLHWRIAIGCAIGCLVALAVLWSLVQARKFHTKRDEAEMTLRALAKGSEDFHAEFGLYPTGSAEEIIQILTHQLPGGGPVLIHLDYSEGKQPVDPWGINYHVLPTTEDKPPEFYSSGPNRIDESCRPGSDDVYIAKQ